MTEAKTLARNRAEEESQLFIAGYNAAIDAAAMTAKTWGPPNWSWSESSIIIKDTCDDIADAIRRLRR
jgi:hypothetical protein